MTRIRKWLRSGEDKRPTTYVEVEEREDAERKENERAIASDAQHGLLPLAGRRIK